MTAVMHPLSRYALARVERLAGALPEVPQVDLADPAAWGRAELRSTSAWSIPEVLGELGRFNSAAWVGAVDVPTAVVVTAKDHTIPARRQRKLAASIPGAQVVRGPGRARVAVPRGGDVGAGVRRGGLDRRRPGCAFAEARGVILEPVRIVRDVSVANSRVEQRKRLDYPVVVALTRVRGCRGGRGCAARRTRPPAAPSRRARRAGGSAARPRAGEEVEGRVGDHVGVEGRLGELARPVDGEERREPAP